MLRADLGSAYVGGFLDIAEDFEVAGNRPVRTAYGWERCDASGASCTTIPGKSSSDYRVQQEDLGLRLRGRVTATDRDGQSVAHTALSDPVVQEDLGE